MSNTSKHISRQRQQGAVSLIVVIFTALLMTVVTISFVTLMTKDQQQASNSDLSQSAYDSAQGGVEDAKRLLVAEQACHVAPAGPNCTRIDDSLRPGVDGSTSCWPMAKAGLPGADGQETILRVNAGDAKLDQAYTCVKIKVNTPDYLGQLSKDEATVVPLRSTSTFNNVKLSWFSNKDSSGSSGAIDLPSPSTSAPLPPSSAAPGQPSWPSNRPSLMRAQVIQVSSSFKLSDLDTNSNSSSASTLFLYPSQVGTTLPSSLSLAASDTRASPPKEPQQIRCQSSLNNSVYACSVILGLNGSHPPGDPDVFLNLSALYNATHFQVQLMNGSSPVPFNNVQPEVDSTGRANNLFRRLVSRVELRGDFTYPNAELDVNGNLCKNFFVTDRAYQPGSCQP